MFTLRYETIWNRLLYGICHYNAVLLVVVIDNNDDDTHTHTQTYIPQIQKFAKMTAEC
jgi:hypothetical protein